MNQEDRFKIQSLLADGFTFKAIARAVGKDHTTISKEVKKHTVVKSQLQVQHYDTLGNPIIKFCSNFPLNIIQQVLVNMITQLKFTYPVFKSIFLDQRLSIS